MGKKSKRRPQRQQPHHQQRASASSASSRHPAREAAAQQVDIAGRRRTFALPRSSRGYYNPEDDIDRAVTFMLKGVWTSKDLAKHMPHTAQDIADGVLSPKDFVAQFAQPVLDSVEPDGKLEKLADYVQLKERKDYMVHDITKSMTGYVFLPYLEGGSIPATESRKYEDLLNAFGEQVATKLISKVEEEAIEVVPSASLFENLLKKFLREACEEWSRRLDTEYFPGHHRFLDTSPLFTENSSSFTRYLCCAFHCFYTETVFPDYKKRLLFALEAAAGGVARNVHMAKSMTCWECDKECMDLQKCTACNVASYCSKKCQLTAWRQGHKENCELLRFKQSILDSSLQAIDAAHESGTIHGIQLSAFLDYLMLPELIKTRTYDSFGGSIGGPSMLYFYQNLGRVVRKEWWLYDENCNVARSGFSLPKNERLRQQYHTMLCVMLCYDYVGYEKTSGVPFSKDAFPDFASWLDGIAGMLNGGKPMSAIEFIENYTSFPNDRAFPYSGDQAKHRRQLKADAMECLRQRFHK